MEPHRQSPPHVRRILHWNQRNGGQQTLLNEKLYFLVGQVIGPHEHLDQRSRIAVDSPAVNQLQIAAQLQRPNIIQLIVTIALAMIVIHATVTMLIAGSIRSRTRTRRVELPCHVIQLGAFSLRAVASRSVAFVGHFHF